MLAEDWISSTFRTDPKDDADEWVVDLLESGCHDSNRRVELRVELVVCLCHQAQDKAIQFEKDLAKVLYVSNVTFTKVS